MSFIVFMMSKSVEKHISNSAQKLRKWDQTKGGCDLCEVMSGCTMVNDGCTFTDLWQEVMGCKDILH